ncbi:MAG TPA: class F sortase [Candidatus Saccharimonadales bacterium]
MLQPAPASQSAKPVAAEPNRSLPARLRIPALNVDAKVLYMGTAASGNMDVPTDVADTGWYKHGALPGNTGSAVIAGHVNGRSGQPGVFVGLTKLKPGDMLSVTDTNGLTTDFIVRASKEYGSTEQPDEVFHSSGGAHLNLITCVGEWNNAERQYSHRLVVFTDRK